jgi:hypothetical protein
LIKYALLMLGVSLLVACGGGVGEEPEDAPSFAEIAPVWIALALEPCYLRLVDEIDDAPTKTLDGGRIALAVCARVSDSDEWVVVDGVLSAENTAGDARVLPVPPDNASAFADAPASLEVRTLGHVRITAAVGDMTASGMVEIVADEF